MMSFVLRTLTIVAVCVAMLVVASWSSSSKPSVEAGGSATPASQSSTSASGSSASTASTSGKAADAAVPTDCSALKTAAVEAMLGGTPVLDSDSEFNETLKELHCIWYTNDAVSEKVSVQLGGAKDFIGFYGSQEGTGTSTFTKVDGFDDGRLYGDDILIAKRNGFAVAVDARSVFPKVTQAQMVAVAQEATAA
jgi:hypothetical protein